MSEALTIHNMPHGLFDWFKELCNAEEVDYCEEWKYSHVVYDYKPFCLDGFRLCVTIRGRDINKLHFIEHLYKERLSKNNKLEAMMAS